MKRRQVVGLFGALAAGGATAIGSGAFSSTEARRTISLEIEGDEAAYLHMEPTDEFDANFATINESTDLIQFDVNDVITNDDAGRGVGSNSEYVFENIVSIRNSGTQTVYLEAEFLEVDEIDGMDLIYDNNRDDPLGGDQAVIEIDSGDSAAIGFLIDTSGVVISFDADQEKFEGRQH